MTLQSYNHLCCVSPDEVCSYGRLHPPPPPTTLTMHAASKLSWVESWAEGGEDGVRLRLSVSGWQGFSSTPSHSSNEVIKWMNEAWKETCCWGPWMPLPTLHHFASRYIVVEDRKRLTGGWGNFCNVSARHLSILGGMHTAYMICACYNRCGKKEG